MPTLYTYVKTLTGNDERDGRDKRNPWQLIGRLRHMGLAGPKFQSQTVMAARSEYDLILY